MALFSILFYCDSEMESEVNKEPEKTEFPGRLCVARTQSCADSQYIPVLKLYRLPLVSNKTQRKLDQKERNRKETLLSDSNET